MIPKSALNLKEELEKLHEKIAKVFIKELTILCKKHNVDFKQYSYVGIYDKKGNKIESGIAYNEIMELYDWLEDDMLFSFQTIECNDEVQLAH